MEIKDTINIRSGLNKSKVKDNPQALDQAATEVEALFINEMLKVMRQSTPSMSGKGLGADIYTGMFDTELSKVLAQRGLGFKEPLVEQLTRVSMGVRPPASMGKGKRDDKQDAEIDNFDDALGVASQKVK
jgi:flagellar protein FlgJ